MNQDFQAIFDEAQHAAVIAVANKPDGYPCGFAWVTIKPARGKFVSWLKERKLGRLDSYYGGYVIGAVDAFGCYLQNMDVKEDGCRAFAEVLKSHGINAGVRTRID